MNTRLTTIDLPQLHRFAVGFDSLFDDFAKMHQATTNTGNYPPYNIVKYSDTEYVIEVAVAGFSQKELDVEIKEGQLFVTGTKVADSRINESAKSEYLHQGISNRDFVRTFNLAENIEIRGAVVENGLLKIQLERIIPESQKPKKIAITFKK